MQRGSRKTKNNKKHPDKATNLEANARSSKMLQLKADPAPVHEMTEEEEIQFVLDAPEVMVQRQILKTIERDNTL